MAAERKLIDLDRLDTFKKEIEAEFSESSEPIANAIVDGTTPAANATNAVNATNAETAAKADKLTTARNLKVALGTTTAQSFDGSAAAESIGVSGTLAVGNGGTGQTDLTKVTVGKATEAETTSGTLTIKQGSDTLGTFNGSDATITIPESSGSSSDVTITLNGSKVTDPSFYAPTASGTSGYILQSNGSGKAPTWIANSGSGSGSGISGTYGSNTNPIYINNSNITAMTCNVGEEYVPVYFSDGEIKACSFRGDGASSGIVIRAELKVLFGDYDIYLSDYDYSFVDDVLDCYMDDESQIVTVLQTIVTNINSRSMNEYFDMYPNLCDYAAIYNSEIWYGGRAKDKYAALMDKLYEAHHDEYIFIVFMQHHVFIATENGDAISLYDYKTFIDAVINDSVFNDIHYGYIESDHIFGSDIYDYASYAITIL